MARLKYLNKYLMDFPWNVIYFCSFMIPREKKALWPNLISMYNLIAINNDHLGFFGCFFLLSLNLGHILQMKDVFVSAVSLFIVMLFCCFVVPAIRRPHPHWYITLPCWLICLSCPNSYKPQLYFVCSPTNVCRLNIALTDSSLDYEYGHFLLNTSMLIL